jgi:hypothetical protein
MRDKANKIVGSIAKKREKCICKRTACKVQGTDGTNASKGNIKKTLNSPTLGSVFEVNVSSNERTRLLGLLLLLALRLAPLPLPTGAGVVAPLLVDEVPVTVLAAVVLGVLARLCLGGDLRLEMARLLLVAAALLGSLLSLLAAVAVAAAGAVWSLALNEDCFEGVLEVELVGKLDFIRSGLAAPRVGFGGVILARLFTPAPVSKLLVLKLLLLLLSPLLGVEGSPPLDTSAA